MLNPAFRFGREELGASVTATGRQITTFMIETIGQFLTDQPCKLIKTTSVDDDGKLVHAYHTDNDAIIYGDTDSVDKNSYVRTSAGHITIETLFNKLPVKWSVEGKEYASDNNLTAKCFNGAALIDAPVRAVYRHKVTKPRWKITLEDGKEVIVTSDHSIMVKRDYSIIAVKPADIRDIDGCVSIKDANCQVVHVAKVEKLDDFRDEYVYDIIMKDESTPYFFANDILVHNSCYYKTYGADKAEAVEIADLAANHVNASFSKFMRDAFNCQPEFSELIKAGREIVGVRGLFQAKKKYMIKVVDLEGIEVDKMKSMGSEIKKADTPKIIQKFLKTTVDMILDGKSYDDVATYVNSQRKEILKNKENVFSLGVAKQVNNLDKFLAEYNNPGTIMSDSGGKLTIPGHVRASCNYNFLLNIFDKGAKTIRSGDKVVTFILKKNEYNFDSIGFPAESSKFPKWFEENFMVDIKATEQRMFDNKLKGIFSALGKDIPSPQSVLTNSILSF